MSRQWLRRVRATAQRSGSPRTLPSTVLDCSFAVNQYGAYAVPHSSAHRPAALAILNGWVWEPETVELLMKCDPAADVVHAGTFFGDFLPPLARSRTGGARVYAFEPSLENYRCAQITVLLNQLDNVVLTHAALDARSGEGDLAIRATDGEALGGLSHLVDTVEVATDTTERVQLKALDEVLPADRRIGLIHLDVEGHEQAALEGALATIRRWQPTLVLESPPEQDWFDQHVGLQYRVTHKVCGNAVLVPS
jgi:FkbM family methyltransferase